MRTGEHLVKKKMEEYQKNEIKIWETLRGMTDREIALSSIGNIAKEAGVGRNTLYQHRSAYQHITECRIKEAERMKKFELQK